MDTNVGAKNAPRVSEKHRLKMEFWMPTEVQLLILSPVYKGSNLDKEIWDNVHSTMYSSVTPLAIDQ
eukprot:15343071-Ditylum_brightwellii.AAC.2